MIEESYNAQEVILQQEGVALIPGNIEFVAVEVSLVSTMSHEAILRSYIDQVKLIYNYVLIDCMSNLGMLNALAAVSVIIPVQVHYVPAKGMTQIFQIIACVRRQINPKWGSM